MSEETKNKPPVFKVKVGSIECAVWEQEAEKGTFLTVSTVRNYKDKDDQWKKSNTLRINDVPAMELGLQECYKYAKLKHGKKEE